MTDKRTCETCTKQHSCKKTIGILAGFCVNDYVAMSNANAGKVEALAKRK